MTLDFNIMSGPRNTVDGDNESSDDVQCCNTRCQPQKAVSYVILAAMCLSVFGSRFCSHIPAALEHTIINVMRLDFSHFELLYSFYYWPNIILVLIGGVLVDKVLGLRVGYFLSLVLSCIGQLSIALGGFFDQFWLMVLGRLVLGTGNFMVMLTVDVFLVHLFRNQLSFAVSFVYCITYTSKAINFELTQLLYNTLRQHIVNAKTCLGLVLLIGFVLCVISLLSGCIAITFDFRRNEKSSVSESKLSLREIINISKSFWIYTLIPLFYYAGLTPFISIGQTFIIHKYSFSAVSASFVNGLIYFLPAIFLPLVGCVINRTGYKMSWGILAVVMIIVGQCLYTFSGPVAYIPYISTLMFGLSLLTFCCTAWTFGLLLVRQQQVASANGIAYALFNISDTIAISLTGIIVDNLGYFFAELLFCSTACLCLLAITALYIVDSVFGSGDLNTPGWRSRKPTATSI